MRICLISREYPTDDHAGGIATYTEKTARALARLGHHLDVITEAADEQAPLTSLEEGVRVHRLPPVRVRRLRTLARARAVARRIAELDGPPDIVQACEFGAEGFWLAVRKPRGVRLVTRLATPSFLVRELNQSGHGGRRLPDSMLDRLERFQTQRSDAVIAISHAVAEVVVARWALDRSRVSIVKTGVDFASRYQHDRSAVPPELGGRPYLLFFGRLEERKGVQVLARALPQVLDAWPELAVVFAGNPERYEGVPMDEWIRARNADKADRLHFLPRQDQPALHALIDGALIVVLPSLWEGLGNVALEAIDMGKPVIATSGSGFSDVIEHRDSGWLVPPGEVGALGDALHLLIGDGALRRQLADGAARRARSFELMRVASELVDFYEAVLAGSPLPSPGGGATVDRTSARPAGPLGSDDIGVEP